MFQKLFLVPSFGTSRGKKERKRVEMFLPFLPIFFLLTILFLAFPFFPLPFFSPFQLPLFLSDEQGVKAPPTNGNVLRKASHFPESAKHAGNGTHHEVKPSLKLRIAREPSLRVDLERNVLTGLCGKTMVTICLTASWAEI